MYILLLVMSVFAQPPAARATPFFSLTNIDDAAIHLVFLRQSYLHLKGLIETSGNTVNIKERLERYTNLPKAYIGLSPTWTMKVGSVNDEGVHFAGEYGHPGGWTTRIRMLKFDKSALIIVPHDGDWTKKLKRGDQVKLTATIADCTLEEIVLENIKIEKAATITNPPRKKQ